MIAKDAEEKEARFRRPQTEPRAETIGNRNNILDFVVFLFLVVQILHDPIVLRTKSRGCLSIRLSFFIRAVSTVITRKMRIVTRRVSQHLAFGTTITLPRAFQIEIAPSTPTGTFLQ
jgi:hypothetical protein